MYIWNSFPDIYYTISRKILHLLTMLCVEIIKERYLQMKVSVILAHPDPSSFNHAIAKTTVATLKKNGHAVYYHDLYKEKFDPLLPKEEIPKDVPLPSEIETHCKEVAEVDGFVIIHPNWWGMPPAILTGWVDRVMRPGIAYEFLENDNGEGVPNGLLRAEKAIIKIHATTIILAQAYTMTFG